VNQSLFIAVVGPAVSISLAAIFFLATRFCRNRGYLLKFGIAYLCSSAGFVLQSFDLGVDPPLARLVSSLFFICGLALLVSGAFDRRGIKVPWLAIAAVAATGAGFLVWFTVVVDWFAMRAFSLNLSLAGICFVSAVRFARAPGNEAVDRMLIGFALYSGCEFVARPIAFTMVSHGFDGTPSPYWLTTSLSASVSSVLVAFALLAAVASDVLRDLKRESRTDALSQLLNRRGFGERAAEVAQRCHADATPVAVVLADLDRFKAINDLHGHAAGDEIIAGFGRLVGQLTPADAVAGRIGGEEFALVIPGVDLAAARALSERLREALATSSLGTPGVGMVTSSFGVAKLIPGEALDAALGRADQALRSAKREGRNCVRTVHVRSEPASPPLAA
jgi:diguanylate cyclase (GGDEF)-like protein